MQRITSNQYLAWLVLIISVAYGGYLSIHITKMLIDMPTIDHQAREAVVTSEQKVQKKSQLNGLKSWSRLALFGKAQPQEPRIVVSSLAGRIRVKGIYAGSHTISTPSAIIEIAGGTEKVMQTGDKLPDGSVVKRIDERKVIIERQGRLEALVLDEPPMLFG